MDFTVAELAGAAVTVVVAAAVSGTVGMGFNIVAVPVMSLINPLMAPVPQLILSLPQTIAAVVRERSSVDRRGVLWILIGRLPGAVIGVWLLTVATKRALDFMIGGLVLVAVIILSGRFRLRRNRPIEFGVGLFAGVSSYVSTIGGPPIALLYSRDEGPRVRATLGLIFFAGAAITLVARIAAGDIGWNEVWLGVGLLPAAAVGFALSSWLKERVPPGVLRIAILTISAAAAVLLYIRAALG